MSPTIEFILRWGMIGSAVITIYLLVVWQMGLLGAVAPGEQPPEKPIGRAGLIAVFGTMGLYIILLCVADAVRLPSSLQDATFFRLFSINYLIYVFWVLYDTFVIDIGLITKWHPPFLRLPTIESHGTVRYHLGTIPKGMLFGAIVTLVATLISWIFLV